MEAVGIGDLHFDGPFTKLVPHGAQVICQEVQKILDWARKRGIGHVFYYGDICDSPRMSYESIRAFTKLINDNCESIETHIILGNHDKFAPDSSAGHSLELLVDWLGIIPNTHVYTEPTDIEIDGVGVRFLPWPSRAFSKRMLNVAHIETAGSKSDSGREMDPEGLYAGNAVIVAGHLHTNQVVRNTYFSGTPFQQNFGEGIKKYFHHIRFESVKDFDIESIRTRPEYRLHNIVVKSKRDLELIPDDKKDLVKLILRDGADVDVSEWASKTNVVKTTGYKSREELESVLSEDLAQSEQITVDTTEFFKAWLDTQTEISDDDRAAVLKLRRSILRRRA